MPLEDFIITRQPNFSWTNLDDEENLQVLLDNEDIIEAIYIASSEFYEVIKRYKKGEITKTKDRNRFWQSFKNYLLRMSTNPIPFGLFSSVGMHRPNNKTRQGAWRTVDLDGEVYLKIVELLHSKPSILPKLQLGLNSSLKKEVDGELLYSEKKLKKKKFEIEISSISNNELLEAIIEVMNSKGFISFQEALNLGIDLEFSEEDILPYFTQLLENNIFVSQLTPNTVIDRHRYQNIAEVLDVQLITDLTPDLVSLQKVTALLDEINGSYKNALYLLLKVADLLEKANIDLANVKSPFAVVSYNTKVAPQLSEDIKDQALVVQEMMLGLFETSKIEQSTITNFENAFKERYFGDAVPLEEALDPIKGIGYPVNQIYRTTDPIAKGLPKRSSSSKKSSKHSLDAFETLLFEKLSSAPTETLQLDQHPEFKPFFKTTPNKYRAEDFCIMLDAETENNSSNFVFNHSCLGTQTRLIGRFGVGSKDIEEAIEHLNRKRKAESPNQVIADLSFFQKPVHLNIASTTSGFDYEIVHLNGGHQNKNKLKPQDLYLQMVRGELVLFDKLSKKAIEVYVGSAVNLAQSLDPIVRFLSEYQYYKSIPALRFFLPSALKNKMYVPQIRFKNLIVSPARWILRKENLEDTKDSKLEALKALLKKSGLVNDVYLIENEDRHRFEAYSSFGLTYILNQLKKKGQVTLQESLIGIDGSFQQALLFGKRDQTKRKTATVATSTEVSGIDSDILSFSIYLKEKNNEKILKKIEEKILTHCPPKTVFLIKYWDPKFHFRLRFTSWQSQVETQKVLQALFDLQDGGSISHFKLEPFRPEYNRYGGRELIKHAYSIFCSETDFVLNEVKESGTVPVERVIDRIQEYLELYSEFDDPLELLTVSKDGFLQEFGLNTKSGKKFLEQKYRSFLPHLESTERKYQLSDEERKRMKVYLGELKAKGIMASTMPSLIHMLINRSMSSSPREIETILYFTLWRYTKMIKYRSN